MGGEQPREGALSGAYLTAQYGAVLWEHEREAVREQAHTLYTAFAAACERYDRLLAEWQAVLAHHAVSAHEATERADVLTAQVAAQGEAMGKMIVARRAKGNRSRHLRGNDCRSRVHLRVLRRQLDNALFASLPAPDAPAPLPADGEDIAYFFHDMRNNLQRAILAAAGMARDLPPDRRERYLRTLRRALTNLTEDLHVLDPVESHSQLPARPALVPPPATRTDSDTFTEG